MNVSGYLLTAVLCFLSAGLSAQDGSTKTAKISSYLDQQSKQGLSGSVLVAADKQVLFEGAYGYQDRANAIKNQTNTRYTIASMGKLFTMVGVLKLIEEGKLSLNDQLDQYLSGFLDKRAHNITIEQLLAHRAGWQHYWNFPEFLNNRLATDSIADYMRFIKKTRLDFNPGSRNQYSNIGYIVLGAVIEKVTGEDYYEYINRTIFQPLSMNGTDYANYLNLPEGYALHGGGGTDALERVAARGAADGGGYSTTQDMYKLTKALVYDHWLSEDHLTLVSNLFRSDQRRKDWGLRIAGGFMGVSTVMLYDSEADVTVIVLTNGNVPSAMEVGQKITGILK
ncbi:MAG: beta-lactamase family protein [Roseivirga sp.]|nr:beta-lactamase family protein [Roseivirga sp.]